MYDLNEKLLGGSKSPYNKKRIDELRRKDRLSVVPQQKYQPIDDSFYDFQNSQDTLRRRYHSIVEQPQINWNSEQILERSMIMNEQNIQQSDQKYGNQIISQQKIKIEQKSYASTKPALNKQNFQRNKNRQLNYRIFNMKNSPRTFLYYFNLFFNVLFRIGLVVLLVQLQFYGDGDQNRQQEQIFIQVLLGLQGIVFLLYFLAITKMLYTKSSDISVYFQKQFYEKPYAEIHMQRIMRKHFTIKKIISNLCRLANPRTRFSRDPKIAIMRQQIFRRIQIVFVFMPLLISFIMGLKWFDRTNQNSTKFDVKLLMAIVVSMESVHIIFHYLFIYIFS